MLLTRLAWHPVALSVIGHALWETLKHAGLVDYFDVSAATISIYLALRWIRRTRVVRILQGIVIVSLLYIGVRQTGLVFTASLFRIFLTIVMVSLMSLFQEDLSYFFERLTAYQNDPMHRRTFHALLRSVRHFSKHHIGALIVLKGRDPLDRHVNGGQPLHGRVSGPLLESLFDPHSDGHDGAAILDGDDVDRFGVHLPLSKHLDPDSGLGTRHAAALGLAELTDAFCLVVSETRGSIMVAREGCLIPMGDSRHLESRLADFLREKFQSPVSTRYLNLLRSHPIEKAFSLALGLTLWLVFVKGIRPAQHVFLLPMQVAQVPAGFQLDAIVPLKAIVTLRGLEKDFRVFSPGAPITLETPTAWRKTQNVPLTTDLVHVPQNLRVFAISPDTVLVRFKPRRTNRSLSSSKQKHTKRTWFKIH
jgi:DNA integrity scanning protein DisA with diadenylate cyclase activity